MVFHPGIKSPGCFEMASAEAGYTWQNHQLSDVAELGILPATEPRLLESEEESTGQRG